MKFVRRAIKTPAATTLPGCYFSFHFPIISSRENGAKFLKKIVKRGEKRKIWVGDITSLAEKNLE